MAIARKIAAVIVWLILVLGIMWLMGKACAPPAGADGDGDTAASPRSSLRELCPLSLGAPAERRAGEGGGGAAAREGEKTTPEQAIHELRVRKCTRIVQQLYPRSGFEPYIEFFITEHERLGMGEAWYWSAVYGAANFGLRVRATSAGNCAGPMDVKHYPLVTDPEANICWHCAEMNGFYRQGVRDIDLCKHVFYPAQPHDWDTDRKGRNGRFARTDRRHRECIERGYAVGKLP